MTESCLRVDADAATHGSEWEHNDGWGSGDECTWFGVKCNADGHVHEVR